MGINLTNATNPAINPGGTWPSGRLILLHGFNNNANAVALPHNVAGSSSGIIVDNVSAGSRASSIYFRSLLKRRAGPGLPNCNTTTGVACAVKLTQSSAELTAGATATACSAPRDPCREKRLSECSVDGTFTSGERVLIIQHGRRTQRAAPCAGASNKSRWCGSVRSIRSFLRNTARRLTFRRMDFILRPRPAITFRA